MSNIGREGDRRGALRRLKSPDVGFIFVTLLAPLAATYLAGDIIILVDNKVFNVKSNTKSRFHQEIWTGDGLSLTIILC